MSTKIDANKLYLVKNRSIGTLSYDIPDLQIKRSFNVGETKQIRYAELEALSYIPGGKALMMNYLQITDPAVTKELDIHTEREYFLSEAEITKLLTSGSMDEFLDCLDFAPRGVLDIIKRLSVQLPLNDVAKRNAIKEKTGFDVTVAIENSKVEEKPVETAPVRRTEEKKETPAAPVRRVVKVEK